MTGITINRTPIDFTDTLGPHRKIYMTAIDQRLEKLRVAEDLLREERYKLERFLRLDARAQYVPFYARRAQAHEALAAAAEWLNAAGPAGAYQPSHHGVGLPIGGGWSVEMGPTTRGPGSAWMGIHRRMGAHSDVAGGRYQRTVSRDFVGEDCLLEALQALRSHFTVLDWWVGGGGGF